MRDFDRPLEPSGVADAEALGQAMSRRGLVPGLTLCSGAARARQTLAALASHADTGRVLYLDQLYHADANGYLKTIRAHSGQGALLVVGHNPMMEDLALALPERRESEAYAALQAGFPTCGLAVIDFATALASASLGMGALRDFLVPGDF